MNIDLVARDVRLKGVRPPGKEVLEVDENTPLHGAITWMLGKARAYESYFVRLRLLAHGGGCRLDCRYV